LSKPKTVQCLCPNRHVQTQVSFRGIDDYYAIDCMAQATRELLDSKALDPYCPSCGARSCLWFFEIRDFKTEEIVAGADALRAQSAKLLNGRPYQRPRGMESWN